MVRVRCSDPEVRAFLLRSLAPTFPNEGLQAGGRTNALRAFLKAQQDRGTDFLRCASPLSALHPKGSEEKRLLDTM